jgi:hypothetical protein
MVTTFEFHSVEKINVLFKELAWKLMLLPITPIKT